MGLFKKGTKDIYYVYMVWDYTTSCCKDFSPRVTYNRQAVLWLEAFIVLNGFVHAKLGILALFKTKGAD